MGDAQNRRAQKLFMDVIYPTRSNYVVLLGDTHGLHELYVLLLRNKNRHIAGCDIIHLGDVGIGFREYSEDIKKLHDIDRQLEILDCRLFLIRGNHDCPAWWKTLYFNLKRVFFVPDYTLLQFPCGKRALCVGGAYSIDKYLRTPNLDWWPNEETVYQKTGSHYPILFSHDCPSYCNNTNESLKSYDGGWLYKKFPQVLQEALHNRLVMDKIVQDAQCKRIFHGHYHNNITSCVNGLVCKCINMNEFYGVDVTLLDT